ncbi:MAG: peptidase S8 [Candidatus Aminicenantes bacterium]|nr:MAG: peptidase S8 [Candidatus Aminicenantes bacterium]
MKRNQLSFIVFIIYIFFTSVSFQHSRFDTNKNPKRHLRHKEIRILNKGQPYRSKGMRYAPDQILVKFKASISEQNIKATIAAYQTKKIKRIPRINIYQLQIPKGENVEDVLYVMSRNPDIEYATPNYIAYIAVTPNDTFFDWQYALYNSSQTIGVPGSPQGKERADIKATSAWGETKGDEEVLIAVLDTGVDLEHPDLKNKIYSSGRDFVNEDFDATDDNGHGTHVAGIAAAETNNNEGIAGVAWNCKILPIKVIEADGEGYYSWIIEGIIWAVDNGADVINISAGGDVHEQSLQGAVQYAFNNGVIVAAASGNDGSSVLYPAAYDDYCLAVAASDYNDLIPDWSNFGPEIDVAAPGERIIGPVPTWFWGPDSIPYAYGFGTSLSTPHVAGLSALLKSIKPWLTASEIMNIIRYSADDINESEYPGTDDFIGYGRINMEKALVPIKIKTSK